MIQEFNLISQRALSHHSISQQVCEDAFLCPSTMACPRWVGCTSEGQCQAESCLTIRSAPCFFLAALLAFVVLFLGGSILA